MGCWGVQPFENDYACDWVVARRRELEKSFKKVEHAKDIPRACQYYAEEVRTAAEHMLALDPIVPRQLMPFAGEPGTGWPLELIEVAYAALVRIRYCDEHLQGFRDPERYAAALDLQAHRIKALAAREHLRAIKPRPRPSAKQQKQAREAVRKNRALCHKKRTRRRAV